MFQCEANRNYCIFECATALGGVHKVWLQIGSTQNSLTISSRASFATSCSHAQLSILYSARISATSETQSQTFSILNKADTKKCSVTDRRFSMPFLKQMMLLSFRVPSVEIFIN